MVTSLPPPLGRYCPEDGAGVPGLRDLFAIGHAPPFQTGAPGWKGPNDSPARLVTFRISSPAKRSRPWPGLNPGSQGLSVSATRVHESVSVSTDTCRPEGVERPLRRPDLQLHRREPRSNFRAVRAVASAPLCVATREGDRVRHRLRHRRAVLEGRIGRRCLPNSAHAR